MLSMMTERVIPLSQLSDILPTKPSYTSVYRWCRTGIRGVKLESILVGGTLCTSHEAVDRFLVAVNAAAEQNTGPDVSASAVRKSQVDIAGQRLAAMGL